MRKLPVCLVASLSVASAAAAQQAPAAAPAVSAGVEDIVVTAQKRSENLQEVPIAITAITAEALKNKRVENLLGEKR